uniref:hypothetical protein n=1 Tax=Synechococcus sp. CS-1329 TaxID=2847975 RepID=UPI002880AD48|nr:hypothetical protein [Synechococcus sp. CS-1329]
MDQPSPDADPVVPTAAEPSAAEPSAAEPSASAASSSLPEIPFSDPSTLTLLDQLTEDRLWLLQQIDGGRWPDLRLDLAALERELGQLLDQARQRLEPG